MFDNLRDRIRRDISHLSNKAKRTLTLGASGADSLWLSQAALQTHEEGKLFVLIADNASQCLRLKDEISYFAPELNVVYFPDWETLPYDLVSPHQDLVSERLEILYKLANPNESRSQIDVVLLTGTTASFSLKKAKKLMRLLFGKDW